jgi:CheY-like chemotaxis protein
LEAGKVSLDLGPLIVEEVIADTIEILSSLAARKGLELAYIVDQNVPKTIIGDSSRLRQILTNLLGNAIKFTHHGGVVIRCHLDEKDEDNVSNKLGEENDHMRLRFEVIDTGIGIRPEQQRNLFEPFSQVDGSTTRMYGGTGLGLSICLQLVRLMMGTMNVESQPDSGSNFWFSVMVQKDTTIDTFDSSVLRVSQLAHHSILLATSHDHTTSMVQTLLPEFKVDRTADIQHAVAQALQEHYKILLLDIPPKPNSFIAQQLQSVDDDPECELHIVLLYAPASEGHKVAAEAINGASDRRGRMVKMARPARRAKLLRILEQLVDHPRGHNNTGTMSIQQQQQPQQPQQRVPGPFWIGSRSSSQQHGTRISDYSNMDELAYFKKRPVLIAEDNMVAQKLLRKQLEKMGFVVESANNGEEAVQLYEQRPMDYFSVGFFDHHMPKVSQSPFPFTVLITPFFFFF